METRSITHSETFDTTQEELFRILHTPSAICKWWGCKSAIVVPEKGGFWAATWGDDMDAPDYTGFERISEFDPPHLLVMTDEEYYAKTGPLPFKADFNIRYEVTKADKGATLTVIHTGFPGEAAADDHYNGCIQGWKDTFAGIRKYFEEN